MYCTVCQGLLSYCHTMEPFAYGRKLCVLCGSDVLCVCIGPLAVYCLPLPGLQSGGVNQSDGDMERVREDLMAAQQTSSDLSSQLTLAQDKIQQLVSHVT